MSIREHIESALFLAESSQPLPAFSLLMIAIAGSARRRLPDRNAYGDKSAFCKFLGGLLRQGGFFQQESDYDIGDSGIFLTHNGRSYTLEALIYEQFRCALLHEGGINPAVFVMPEGGLDRARTSYSVSYPNGVLTLDYGWIYKLAELLSSSPVNGAEFGRPTKIFTIKVESGQNQFIEEVRHSFPREQEFSTLARKIARLLTSQAIESASDLELNHAFIELAQSGALNTAMLNLMKDDGAMDSNGNLTPAGVGILRITCRHYESVDFG
ncbi:hypothetical protein RDI61_14300 [Pseudomonas plecoglossicida]|uniref:hypothetical protein n=1 Tax=Pseudomonas TaxID=286 RepID=UPI000B10AB85|nr:MULTISPECIES: hypothetical protein [Pseudomonas]MDQ7965206.1 hypothetical protein [Pseudomonas plecoglossicida]WBM44565.1 hypothetical protein M2J85_17665 [Pseudomonas putida]WFG00989.1 hypothetical protein P3X84_17850 [Pseudomonas putida]